MGDGYIQRLITVARCENREAWPSAYLMSYLSTIEAATRASIVDNSGRPMPLRRTDVYNAGVIGDSTANLIYRLRGSPNYPVHPRLDPANPRPLRSLLEAFEAQNVELWVIHIGTNDLVPGTVFDPVPIYALLDMLLKRSSDTAKVLLTGLFYQTHVPDDYIDKVNQYYKRAVQCFADNYGAARVQYLAPPVEFDMSVHTDLVSIHLDGLGNRHLNLAGYRLWMRDLVPKMWAMLKAPSPTLAPLPPPSPSSPVFPRLVPGVRVHAGIAVADVRGRPDGKSGGRGRDVLWVSVVGQCTRWSAMPGRRADRSIHALGRQRRENGR